MHPQISMLGKPAFLLPKFDNSSFVSQEVELQSYYTPAYLPTAHQAKLNQNADPFANISCLYPIQQNSIQEQRLCSRS
jgi:hypothetical protein